MTDEQLREIRARLEAAESSRISAPSADSKIYTARQAREDIAALLDAIAELQEDKELATKKSIVFGEMLVERDETIERLRNATQIGDFHVGMTEASHD